MQEMLHGFVPRTSGKINLAPFQILYVLNFIVYRLKSGRCASITSFVILWFFEIAYFYMSFIVTFPPYKFGILM